MKKHTIFVFFAILCLLIPCFTACFELNTDGGAGSNAEIHMTVDDIDLDSGFIVAVIHNDSKDELNYDGWFVIEIYDNGNWNSTLKGDSEPDFTPIDYILEPGETAQHKYYFHNTYDIAKPGRYRLRTRIGKDGLSLEFRVNKSLISSDTALSVIPLPPEGADDIYFQRIEKAEAAIREAYNLSDLSAFQMSSLSSTERICFDFYLCGYRCQTITVQFDTSGDIERVYSSSENYLQFSGKVKYADMVNAENTIRTRVTRDGYDAEPHFYLTISDSQSLILSAELIADIPGALGSGCNIDHKHVFYNETVYP